MAQIVQNDQEWNHGLFSCFDNCGVCLCSCFCPCVQYGRNVRILGDGDCMQHGAIFFCCLPVNCLCAMGKRTEMRNKYRLKEVCINDCFTTCCCRPCSLAQIANEIDTRGVPQTQNMS